MTIIGRARRDGIEIEVGPGGALRSLELDDDAIALGATRLAGSITALVREAADQANREARELVAAEVGELAEEALAAVGLRRDDDEEER